ncbi:MAG TPA: DinB family protein [Vicinamibacterales bacterium]|nr:DinB family protein [Vicinamibacterales bacterium]
MESHHELIARTRQSYREAHERFVKRLREAADDAVHRQPPDGGWSAAQIGWHVATVDGQFADIVSGARPVAQPLADGAAERPWSEVVAGMPQKIEAGKRVQPPGDVRRDAVLDLLAESAARLDAALAALDEPRGATCAITHPALGTITLRQFGEWATAHTIRHNAQAKRVLGS